MPQRKIWSVACWLGGNFFFFGSRDKKLTQNKMCLHGEKLYLILARLEKAC